MNIIHCILWDLKCAHVPDTVYRIISVQTGRHILAALAGGGGGGGYMAALAGGGGGGGGGGSNLLLAA